MEVPAQKEIQTRNFFRAIHDEDSFTIVYELASNDAPVAVEGLRKAFGADVAYLGDILNRLQRLGVVGKKGSRWVIREWARDQIKFLEKCLENIALYVPETRSNAAAVTTSSITDPGTTNGLWTGAVSHVTVVDSRLIGLGIGAGTISETPGLAPETPDRGQSEARSHDYK